jgi:hypothetical protein
MKLKLTVEIQDDDGNAIAAGCVTRPMHDEEGIQPFEIPVIKMSRLADVVWLEIVEESRAAA